MYYNIDSTNNNIMMIMIMPLALVLLYTLLLGSGVGGVAAFSSPSPVNNVMMLRLRDWEENCLWE